MNVSVETSTEGTFWMDLCLLEVFQSVFLPEIYEVTLQQNGATVFDLKNELDEEYGVGDADRLSLYYFGILLEDDLKIEDIVSDDLGGSRFSVSLPKASQSVPAERFLIVGRDRKFKACNVDAFIDTV